MNLWNSREIGPYTEEKISGLEPRQSYVVRIQSHSIDGRYGNLSETVVSEYNGYGNTV